jgi:hypothetical protein
MKEKAWKIIRACFLAKSAKNRVLKALINKIMGRVIKEIRKWINSYVRVKAGGGRA